MKKIVVPKEKAVFWLDKNGRWHNEHGEFEHKRVIDYFHSAIRKDKDGYYLFQTTDEFEEKVYFPHDDTALFVFDVILGGEITLVLNTKRTHLLVPEDLYIHEDNLYITLGEEVAKFTSPCLMKISKILDHEGDETIIRIKDQRVVIDQR